MYREITQEELKEILRKHKLWLEGDSSGVKANLRGANLSDADLSEADLRGADLSDADLHGADLRGADLRGADLSDADLRGADLRGADLRGADLRDADLSGADLSDADLSGADLSDADLDYSCWPLWCGSLGAKVDQRIAAQIAYHFCRLDCDDPDYLAAREAIKGFANQFHRVDECGVIE